ncbi:MAG: U32 family peptidase [Treponema sp.]|nr:U32 family peptidase [Treponema sp.]
MMNAELLAPAGDMNKLHLAVKYGADAVYLGGRFGLRAAAAIENDCLKEAVSYAHSHGKKIYITVNIFARNADFDEIKTYVKWLQEIGVDAVIVSDLGVLKLVRENTSLDVHISTQANVINKFTAQEYVKLGAKRIILARECSNTEIKEIADHLKNECGSKCEIEIFVHGAMCVSYSGRCMISNYMTDREANRGECSQPCRYKYFMTASMKEEKRPSQYWDIEEDANGTYIMNSKDLCLINHLYELKKCGVTSFKIEGRMKSDYYVAAAVNTYRHALNKETEGKKFDYQKEIEKISHRPYTTGFVFEKSDNLFIEHTNQISTHDVVGMCLGGNKVLQRNVFNEGDELEILSPGKNHNRSFIVKSIKDEQGQNVTRANKAGAVYCIELDNIVLEADEFLRKEKINEQILTAVMGIEK